MIDSRNQETKEKRWEFKNSCNNFGSLFHLLLLGWDLLYWPHPNKRLTLGETYFVPEHCVIGDYGPSLSLRNENYNFVFS